MTTLPSNRKDRTSLGSDPYLDASIRTKKEMHEHFTNIANVYREVRTTDEEPILLIQKELGDRKAVKAVEIGCGTGRYTTLLFRHLPNLKLTCVDSNREMLTQLSQNLTERGISNWETVWGRVEDLGFEDESLDCVFSFNAVHHFDFEKFISKAGRAIKEDGRIFIYTRTPSQNADSIWGRYFPKFLEKETRLFELAEMEKWIDETEGLSLMLSKTFCYPRRSTLDRLLKQVSNRHYSTFSLYTENELEAAIEAFRENVVRNFDDPQRIEWDDKNVMLQIGRTPA